MNDISSTIYEDNLKIISDLQDLIHIPSISAKKQNLLECAALVSQIMKKSGIDSEILFLDEEGKPSSHPSSTIPPIVFGQVKSKSNPTGPTLLFYNHYDVQPVDPIDLWDNAPFSGIVKGNYIFGRGSSDDKGELITRIKAVESILRDTGDVPCNIKFIVEGEEEIGSPNIVNYINAYREKFRSEKVIWEFGYIDEMEKPVISLGMKGLLFVELIAKGPSRDAHSSLAVLIKNPAWVLTHLLSTIFDRNGKITIKDWYKDIQKPTPEELQIINQELFDEKEFQKQYGISEFLGNIHGNEVKKALSTYPTCNIAGLFSGYIEEGAKTVLPSKAIAKLDFRLVPNMDPAKQLKLLQTHIKENGFENNIDINVIHSEPASKTSINDPFVKLVEDSASDIFGSVNKTISSSGTGPMFAFNDILGSPSVSVGCTYIYSKIHSPNEFMRLDLLFKTVDLMKLIINRFSSLYT